MVTDSRKQREKPSNIQCVMVHIMDSTLEKEVPQPEPEMSVVVGYEFMGQGVCCIDKDINSCGGTRFLNTRPDEDELSTTIQGGTSSKEPQHSTAPDNPQSCQEKDELIEILTRENDALKQAVRTLSEANEILGTQITEMANQNDDLQLRIEERDMKNNFVQTKLYRSQEQNNELTTRLRLQDEVKVQDMTSALEELRGEILLAQRAREKDNKEHEYRVKLVESEKDQLALKIKQLEEKIEFLKNSEEDMALVIGTLREKLESNLSTTKNTDVPSKRKMFHQRRDSVSSTTTVLSNATASTAGLWSVNSFRFFS